MFTASGCWQRGLGCGWRGEGGRVVGRAGVTGKGAGRVHARVLTGPDRGRPARAKKLLCALRCHSLLRLLTAGALLLHRSCTSRLLTCRAWLCFAAPPCLLPELGVAMANASSGTLTAKALLLHSTVQGGY